MDGAFDDELELELVGSEDGFMLMIGSEDDNDGSIDGISDGIID